MPSRAWKIFIRTNLIALAVCATANVSSAQIRVATYNTLGKPSVSLDETEFETIMNAIGNTSANGIAKRVDILGLQEGVLTLSNDTFDKIADSMNSLYGVTSYTKAVIGSGSFKVGYVYDSSTVDLLSSTAFFIGTRPAHRAQFRPVGYTSTDAELYTFDVHLKAGKSGSDLTTRYNESINLRANADALGDGKNLIYMGDFNYSRSDEPGYVELLSSGNGQAFDPIDAGFWPSLSGAPEILTQSTRSGSLPDGGASGGLDDRFDLQVVSGELLDGEGLSYIGPTSTGLGALDHSYQAFGNDGVSANTSINNTYVGRSQSAAVLDALYEFSDHLPVFADYQIPASMDAMLTSVVPTTVNLNDTVDLDVLVENIASVVATAGADELDYTLSVSGDLSGSATDIDAALGGGNTHQVALDTASLGMKFGVISVSSSSLGVENSLIQIPVSFEVVQPFAPEDLNMDGFVDGLDLGILLASWGQSVGPEDGELDAMPPVDGLDLGILLAAWDPPPLAAATVPEPSALILMGLCFATLGLRNHRKLI